MLKKTIDFVYDLVTTGCPKKCIPPVRNCEPSLKLSVCFKNNIKHNVHNLGKGHRYPQYRKADALDQTESAVVTMDGTEADSSPATTGGATKRKSDETNEPEPGSRGKRRRGRGGKKLRPGERYVPPPQKRNQGVGFSQEHFDETSYYFEDGLRKVHPYYFDFKTYCKGRWIGKTLLEVFKSEFRAESIDYYQRAAKEGRIRLNETPVDDLSVVLKVSIIIFYMPLPFQ